MPLALPKSRLQIRAVSIACRDVDLIEGHVNRVHLDLSVGFPVGFLSSVEVLADGIGTGVPEANTFDEVVAEGVVGEGKHDIEAGISI